MISELNDNDILDFLMTSDFEGDYKPEQLKYLLTKWRYFYRILYTGNKSVTDELTFELTKTKDEINSLKNYITSLQKENAEKQNIIDFNISRKLNWKERLTGKINIKKDEN